MTIETGPEIEANCLRICPPHYQKSGGIINMCGIVGYVGRQEAAPILLDGLERLEYRGYDSAGIAVCGDGVLRLCKKKGRVAALRELTHDGGDLAGTLGIGHTRWATHGEPNDVNAHPHMSQSGKFAVVHNGIIENFITLKEELQQKGYVFQSETDTEVVAQLLDYYYSDCGDFFEAMNRLLHAVDLTPITWRKSSIFSNW